MVRLSLRLGPLAPVVARRVIMSVAAEAGLAVDRCSEVALACEVMALTAAELTTLMPLVSMLLTETILSTPAMGMGMDNEDHA